jgi:PKD repeat protein
MKISGSNILLAILTVQLLLGSIVSAADYCTAPPTGINYTINHNGDWYNITITFPACFDCVDNGAGYGDVECTPCAAATFRSNVTCGIVPFAVQYNDTSTITGITGYYWDFATSNSTLQNPVVWYNVSGMYGVDHSVTDGVRTFWTNKTNYMAARVPGDTCAGGGSMGSSGNSTNAGGEVMWLAFGLVGGAVGLLFLSKR